MKDQHDSTKNNVAVFPKTQVRSVYELDKVLSMRILEHVKEHSWRKLAAQVNIFVREQYKPVYGLVSEGEITPEALEAEIKSYVPSRSYIEAFAKGTAICYRYTNTLANFFEQRYSFKNFNPCDQYLMKLDDQTTGSAKWPRQKTK